MMTHSLIAAVRLLFLSALLISPFGHTQVNDGGDSNSASSQSASASSAQPTAVPRAESIDLKEVITELQPTPVIALPIEIPSSSSSVSSLSASSSVSAIGGEKAVDEQPVAEKPGSTAASSSSADGMTSAISTKAVEPEPEVIMSKFILGVEVPPSTATRLVWMPEEKHSGFSDQTPVLVVNGANPGKTLCLTAAVHGDELNGIEMIRRVMYNLDPEKLTGTVIGVPVVNLLGFRRNSRYLPDRRDLNRYFPGNTKGSAASRIAYSFFSNVIRHCDALVDIHTGSFHRSNLPQLRADLSNERVVELAQKFGTIAVLNGRGYSGCLRAAAVRFGIPAVTLEAGEPMRLQENMVAEGAKAIETLLTKTEMYGRQSKWSKAAPVYYKSSWIRANQSGILFSNVALGKNVTPGEVLGTVTDPITNARSEIISPYRGRILGMALDQVVMPGFAAYHIGIQTPEAVLIEEGGEDSGEGDDETNPLIDEENTGTQTEPQDNMEDE